MNSPSSSSNLADAHAFKGYLSTVFVVSLLSLVLIGVANALIDPYARYELVRKQGFNELKPAAIDQVSVAKFYQVSRNEPTTVLLGNSRVDIGLDPQSAYFDSRFQPVYNYAIPGSSVHTDFKRLKRANASGQVSHVILGIDFLDFGADPEGIVNSVQAEAKPDWLSNVRTYSHDSLTTLLSLSATADSLRTIVAQGNPDAGGMSSQGLNYASQYRSEIRNIGHLALFQDKNRNYVDRLQHKEFTVFNSGTRDSTTWRELAALLSYCREHEINVTLFIHPYHADMLEIFYALNLWDEFSSWKTQILQVIDANLPGAPLWDFSGHTLTTTERVPVAGDKTTAMQWYWESGHYKRELGERMLRQMLLENRQGEGVLLDRRTVHLTLAAATQAMHDYSKKNPDTRVRINELIKR